MSSAEQQARDEPLNRARRLLDMQGDTILPWVASLSEMVAEVEYLRERQESHDLANEAIRQKKRANDAAAELCRLRAQETRIRALCEDPSHGPLYPHKILAALDTEEGQA